MLDDYMMFASVLPSKENQFFPSPAFYSDLGESTHHRSQCCNTLDMCNPEDKPVLSIENDFKDPSNKELFSKTEDPLFCESNTITRSIKLITDGDSIEDIDCAKLSYRKLPESETNEIDENEVIKSCQDDATGQNLVQRDILGEHPRFDSKDILMTLGPETNEVVDNEVIKSCQEDKITEDFSERDTSSNFGSEDITNFSTIEEEEEKKIDIMSSRVQTILIYSGIEGLVETQPPVVVQNEELKHRDDQEKEVQMVVQQVNIDGKSVQDASAIGTGNDEEKKLQVMYEVGDMDRECIKDVSVINIRNNEEKQVAMMIQQVDINKDLIRDVSIVDTSDNEEKKVQITLQQENMDDGCVKDVSSVESNRKFVRLDDFNPTTAEKSSVELSQEMPASEAESEIKEHCFVPSDFINFSALTPRSKHAMESSRSLRSLLSSEDYFFPRKDEHPSTPSIDVKAIEPSNSHISSTTGSNGAGNNNRNDDSYTSFPDKWYEDADEDEFSSGLIAFSGALTHPGLTSSYSAQVPYSGSISHRSDSSMSGRSFAFPILVSDWNSSPVKMIGDDSDENLFDKRRKFWQCCFCCRRPSTSSDD